MKAKKWLLMTLGITMAVLVAMTAVMVYIDPYFHYHGPVDICCMAAGHMKNITTTESGSILSMTL